MKDRIFNSAQLRHRVVVTGIERCETRRVSGSPVGLAVSHGAPVSANLAPFLGGVGVDLYAVAVRVSGVKATGDVMVRGPESHARILGGPVSFDKFGLAFKLEGEVIQCRC